MRRRFILAYVVPVLALLVIALIGPILGRSTFYLRDVANAHAQTKIAQAQLMRQGSLPLVDPFRDGQPLVGNPNAVALYPDNVLYLVAPARWSLGAHLWLHLLLAPFAMYGLGRACGQRRPAAWAAGVVYAASGFALSHLNLYNSVAVMALAPALVAAAIRTARARAGRSRRPLAALAAIGALIVLGGDPPSAAIAVLLAVSGAWALRRRAAGRRTGIRVLGRLGTGLGLALLLAAPQIIELERIRGASFRGASDASTKAVLAQSFDPRSSAEWTIPLIFGPPDRSFWGTAFYGGHEPFYLSLYPGLLALALLLVARRRTRAWAWAWAAMAAGVFVALGAWNPLIRWLVEALGGGGARYPIKAWSAVAVGGALLAGMGFERWREADGRRRLLALLGGFAVAYLLLWQLLARAPTRVVAAFAAGGLQGPGIEAEPERWAALAFISLSLIGAYALLTLAARYRAEVSGAAVLALHTAAQLFFLAPLLATDAAEVYRPRPELARLVPATPWLVHGRTGDLFGPPAAAATPDPRTLWDERRRFASLAPQAGVGWGYRYAFDPSPEGLDSFWSVAAAQAVRALPDRQRLRVLEAFGVTTLILDRPLADDATGDAGLIARASASGQAIWVYKLTRAAPAVGVVGTVLHTDDPNVAIGHLRDPDFDPRKAAVIVGSGRDTTLPAGRLDLLADEPERVVADVDSAEGATLVVQRAWLPIYRASVDGRPVPVRTANLARIAVAVPPGLHRVRLWVDRRPSIAAWLVAALAGVGVTALAVTGGRSASVRKRG